MDKKCKICLVHIKFNSISVLHNANVLLKVSTSLQHSKAMFIAEKCMDKNWSIITITNKSIEDIDKLLKENDIECKVVKLKTYEHTSNKHKQR